jgi:predicted unusual protein kinase regulating ubiquinone biosynthesis (AarF/ABC1/UbiB family)
MPQTKSETLRLMQVAWKLIPVGLSYRSDRREIHRAEGKIPNREKYQRHGARAVKAFFDLGPAYIKLGQLLSVRPDILPQPYIDEFAKLQDEVPPAPFDQVKPMIEQDLGRPIAEAFDSFDQSAVTGASLGQVYKATYRSKKVVVKVNRPNIAETIDVDTKVLKRLVPLVGRFIDKSLEFSARSVIEQFSETIKEEMDYKFEANSLLAIKKNLRSEKDVLIPDIYTEVSSPRVLVLQELEGIKISDNKKLDEAGVDRKRLARRIARIFFDMLLKYEIFHADPHPGNISIKQEVGADGKKSTKIILYDFGMTGSLDPETRLNLIRLYSGLIDYSPSRVIDMMISLGVLQPDANRYVITRGVELALADMHGKKVEETEVRALLEVANRTIYQFPFKLPKNLVLYMRMLSILEGVCLSLDPKFRFVQVLGNLLEEEGMINEVYRAEFKDALGKISKALQASIDIAPLLKGYLEQNYDPSRPINSRQNRTGSGFLLGVFTGLAVGGIALSSFYIRTLDGKLGLVGSLVLLIVSLAWRRN